MTKHGYKAVNQVANSQKIGESAGEGPILGLFQVAVFSTDVSPFWLELLGHSLTGTYEFAKVSSLQRSHRINSRCAVNFT